MDETRLIRFLDSGSFGFCLLMLAVPAAGFVGRIRERRQSWRGTAPIGRFQFSIASLLWYTVAIGAFLSIARLSNVGGHSFAAVLGGYLLLAESFSESPGSRWAAQSLVLVLCYIAVNAVAFFVAFCIDPFSIFNPGFVFASACLAPLVALGIFVRRFLYTPELREHPPWGALFGLIVLMICVGIANLYVIGMASAAV